LARLRRELAGMAASETDWRTLEKLPYLRGCVHESIRLAHGIVTRDPRIAPDTDLVYTAPGPRGAEWHIPRGTPVSMTTVDVLMDPEIFPHPREFRPERWENEDLGRYFVPFGKGSRQCMGIKWVSTLPEMPPLGLYNTL
jgi:cytochrome P450